MSITTLAKLSGWDIGNISRWRRVKPVPMPTTSLAEARAWRAIYAPERSQRRKADARSKVLSLPSSDPRQGREDWLMTPAETRECVEILKHLVGEGASDESHPQHQVFCDGVAIVEKRGFEVGR